MKVLIFERPAKWAHLGNMNKKLNKKISQYFKQETSAGLLKRWFLISLGRLTFLVKYELFPVYLLVCDSFPVFLLSSRQFKLQFQAERWNS